VTPEYNHSFTGVLKNAIDWGSRPWSLNSWGGKPTGIVGASGASGSSFSQAALKLIIEWFKSPLYIEKEIKISLSPETFDDEGKLHQDIVPVAQEYINGFVAWVNENPSKPE
jgi:chromate reductase